MVTCFPYGKITRCKSDAMLYSTGFFHYTPRGGPWAFFITPSVVEKARGAPCGGTPWALNNYSPHGWWPSVLLKHSLSYIGIKSSGICHSSCFSVFLSYCDSKKLRKVSYAHPTLHRLRTWNWKLDKLAGVALIMKMVGWSWHRHCHVVLQLPVQSHFVWDERLVY